MDKTIDLVNHWSTFLKDHPQGSIDDFCRHHLIHRREINNLDKIVGGVVPMTTDGLLMKVIGRIHKIHTVYAYSALEGTALTQIEEFSLLAAIRILKTPRKSDVIYNNLLELSSGIDMLNRLKRKGLVKENTDKDDKRSKRMALTALGEKTMEICLRRILKLARMMLHDMTDDDKQLCIQLLKNVEIKFSDRLPEDKGKKFDLIYAAVMND